MDLAELPATGWIARCRGWFRLVSATSFARRSHQRFGDVLTRRPGRCKGIATTGEGLRQLLLRIRCLVRPGPEISVGAGDDPVAVEA